MFQSVQKPKKKLIKIEYLKEFELDKVDQIQGSNLLDLTIQNAVDL